MLSRKASMILYSTSDNNCFVAQVYAAYKGKSKTRMPAPGEEKYEVLLGIANRKLNEWATDPDNLWNSLWEDRNTDTILVDTQTYNLDSDLFYPSDFIRVQKTGGDDEYVEIIKPYERSLYLNQVSYISGHNPKLLTFVQDISTGNDLIGGTLYVPGYYLPTALTNTSDVIPVDIPEWLVYITASEIARNDPAKDDQYVNLVNQANDLYRKMVNANQSNAFMQPNNVPIDVNAIRGDEDVWYV